MWDADAKKFVAVCKNDAATGGKSGRLAFAPGTVTIYPVDLAYSNLGNVMMAGGGGYWIISSDIRAGQPVDANGLADVHLLHVAEHRASPTPDQDVTLVERRPQRSRAPHLAAYGAGRCSPPGRSRRRPATSRRTRPGGRCILQVLDSTTGMPLGGANAGPLKLTPNVLGSRYQDFRAYPDGSVAYPAPGGSATKLQNPARPSL